MQVSPGCRGLRPGPEPPIGAMPQTACFYHV